MVNKAVSSIRESRIERILKEIDADGYLLEHARSVASLKRRANRNVMSASAIGFAIFVVLIVVGITCKGCSLFLVPGVIGSCWCLGVIINDSLHKRRVAPQTSDFKSVCEEFVTAAFCRDSGVGFEIARVLEFFPASVLANYEKEGFRKFWRFKGDKGGELSMQCSACSARETNLKEAFNDLQQIVPPELKQQYNFYEAYFLQCEYCGSVLCYSCFTGEELLRYLCPFCGKATGGMFGLARRWIALREAVTGSHKGLERCDIEVKQIPRADPRIVDVQISLSTTLTSRSANLSTIALKGKSGWFLIDPEPV